MVITELKKHLEPATEPDELCPVRRAWRYLDNSRDYLAYDQAIKKELPLGSGIQKGSVQFIMFYLEVAPQLYLDVIQWLGRAGSNTQGRATT